MTLLLGALCEQYPHLQLSELRDAVDKYRKAVKEGPFGDRTNPWDWSEPLRGGDTTRHFWWVLGFNNAGVGNWKALGLDKTAKHDPSRNGYQREYQKKRYHQRKKDAIKSLGGKCSSCGTTRGLELDHKKPGTKSFTITKLWSVPDDEFNKEVRKCRLLCKSCHKKNTAKQRENGEVKSVPGKSKYDSKGRRKRKSKKAYADLAVGLLRIASNIPDMSESDARLLGEKHHADWNIVPFREFYRGLHVEMQQASTADEAAKKALDNLALDDDYYNEYGQQKGL